MKNNIKVQTLSQVHVGSGVFLQKGNDFIVVDRGEESDIYVIDPNKLGNIIGTDQATIDEWVVRIESGTAADFIQLRTKGHQPKEYAKRKITNFANFDNIQGTLKECLHDGMGRPYIPGSSIKGAIRTAVVAALARNKGNDYLSQKFTKIFQEENKRKQDKMLSDFEKAFMGNNPNSDLFRFITVGDAFFEMSSEVAVKQINLNIREIDSLVDKKMQQVVEAIGSDEKASFSLKIDKERFELVKNAQHKDLAGLPALPQELKDIPHLFALINQHTKQLVEDEIRIWSEDYGDFKGQSGYVENMEEILDSINSCKANQCVLRLGQAIGWRFITGAWTESLDEDFFYDNIVPKARPRNEQKYSDYVFPKSRRIDDESYVFGFLKLTFEE